MTARSFFGTSGLIYKMIDHDIGVSLGAAYQLKEVDRDYFAMDDADA